MAKRVTLDDIEKINILYLKCGTYAEVARQTGFSPTTVKKYIQKDFKPREAIKINKYTGEIPEINYNMFSNIGNWGELCVLSNDEKDEVRELWEELSL